ncbi:hypothetical protein HK099_002939, partial [Clydaea vesicula]
IGITQGATLFATMLGGLVMKPYLAVISHFNKTYKFMGPKQHCCFQSAATASGALNGGLTAGVIGLFWMQNDSEQLTPAQRLGGFKGLAGDNVLGLFLLVFCAVGFGVFMAVPYRKIFIINQNLQFPDGLAAAEIIHSMYKKGRTAAQDAIQARKIKIMITSFCVGLLLYLVQQFFPALIAWDIFKNLSNCGVQQSADDCIANPPQIEGENGLVATKTFIPFALAAAWGWKLSFDPVLVGTAFIVPHHVNVWFFIGGVLAFGVIGPLGVYNKEYPAGLSYGGAISYVNKHTLLWPAIFVVLFAAFFNIILEYQALNGILSGFKGNEDATEKKSFLDKSRQDIKAMFSKKEPGTDRSDEQTPFLVWFGGFIVLAAITIGIEATYFGPGNFEVEWWHVVVSILSCIVLAVVYLQILGKTNWGIISVMGKTAVMILGVSGAPVGATLTMGNLVAQTMSQVGDLTQCYKTGHLIKASPQAQFVANVIGSVIGLFSAVGGFLLFTTATPCILEYPQTSHCEFLVPSTKAWYNLAIAFNGGFKVGLEKNSTMSPTGFKLCVIFCVLAFITNVAKKSLQVKNPVAYKRWNGFFPMYEVMFIPFILTADLAVATFVGTIIKFSWQMANKKAEKIYGVSLGAGLMTGGAMGGVLYCIMKISGVGKYDYLQWGGQAP